MLSDLTIKSILNNSHDSLIVTDKDENRIFINSRAESLLASGIEVEFASTIKLYDRDGILIGHLHVLNKAQPNFSTTSVELRFRTIFEQSPFSAAIYNRNGFAIAINQAWIDLWQHDEETVKNKVIHKHNILRDPIFIKNGLDEYVKKAYAGETSIIPTFQYDPSIVGFPGRKRWINPSIYPLKNEKGEIHEIVVIYKDVSDKVLNLIIRNDLLKDISFEKNRLATIIDKLPTGVLVSEAPSGRILFKNALGSRIAEDRIHFGEYQKRSLINGEIIKNEEIEAINPDGSKSLINLSSAPVLDSEGKIAAIVILINEVTEEKLLQQKEQFLDEIRTVLLSTIDYKLIIDKFVDHAIPYLSDGIFGDTLEKGKPLRFFAKHIDPNMQSMMASTHQQSTLAIIETGNILLSSDPFPFIGVPLEFKGKVVGALCFVITSNRPGLSHKAVPLIKEIGRLVSMALENALLYRETQKAIEQRDDFISIASHELKTPITSLGLQVEVLGSILKKNETTEAKIANKGIQSTKEQLVRLNQLVDDMLDLSRITNGKLSFDLSEVDLVELTRQTLDRFHNQLSFQKIPLEFKSPDSCKIICDPYRIEQVITNLMTNAIRYGDKTKIQISIYLEKNQVFLKVKDQGRGIPKEDLERIFNRFERGSNATDQAGLGLGLYINRKIINEHQGHIFAESELGHGSSFIVMLPFK